MNVMEDMCGIRFSIPAECHLPAGHAGEHAPDTVARALVTIGIAADELDADRREFARESSRLRDRYGHAIDRLRRISMIVGVVGVICLGTTVYAIWQSVT